MVELALGQARTQFQDEGLYFGQDFPGVGLALKELCGYGVLQIEQIAYLVHHFTLTRWPLSRMASIISSTAASQTSSVSSSGTFR